MFKIYSRKILLLFIDIILINFALYIALYFRYEGHIPIYYYHFFLHYFVALTIFKIFIYYIFGLYTSLWRYASMGELIKVFFAVLLGSISDYGISQILPHPFPFSIYIFSFLFTFIFVGGVRILYRLSRRLSLLNIKSIVGSKKIIGILTDSLSSLLNIRLPHQIRVMIIGSGAAASMIIKELKNHKDLPYVPVLAIDDDKWKHKTKILGVSIKGDRSKIIEFAAKYEIDEIIVTIPSAKKNELAEILKICKQTKCKLKTLPGVYELINNRVTIKQIRDVSIEDLLGREEIKLNNHEISDYLNNEVILVTGGGGSIGSELCRQIAKYNPQKLLIFDIYENNASELQYELKAHYKNLDSELIIGSIRDIDRLNYVFKTYKPGIIFHAAAHKHVPIMEENPIEAIKNNVFGTLNVAKIADKYGVKKFVLISTDKAVNPTNIMGASKRMAEIVIQAIDKKSKTEFVAVRFGNVRGSNGSVIPLFKKQITAGGPITVTHPEITRFFMTIPEAAQLVIQAGAIAKGGEIFILDMGESIKIFELAKDLIKLSGLEPNVDIKIEFVGLRPGEKLYEELLLAEEGVKSTTFPHIFVGNPLEISFEKVLIAITELETKLDEQNIETIKTIINKFVPSYK
ncbi:MAG: nucleoside-diphosphate sugar epimerase/dehydratase [Candidatus Margulisiibacteriota bacterium]|jgi:FlaA1/EpsC-like NDP-sugar epimerase